MDYYGPMVHPFRRIRPAALACVAATCVFPALAQTGERASEPASAPVQEEEEATAALNAELFYELLLGEITTSEGDPATGYNLMLDAARRSGDPQLYRRATEIALQSRSGEYALAAARAWKEALPQSRDANRYLLRILVALNRIDDSAEPLRQELARSSARDKVSTIRALPLLYARAGDKALAARVVRLALEKELNDPALGPMAWTTVGRMYLAADDKARALEAAGNALGQDPGDDGAAMLSLQLLENAVPEAEALLSRYLAGKPLPEVRMAYARVLLESQRLADAQAQVDAVTREQPDNAQAWLIRASLQLQAGELDQAEAALQRCMQLLEQDPATEQRQRALTQISLMQSQIAEKRGDLAQAQAWLARIDDAEQLLAVQSRHASLLVRQGRLDEARALIRAIPEKGPDDARLKLQAEVQLLREAGRDQQAYELQGRAVPLAPLYRVSYDKRVPAGLPTWRRGHQAGLQAHYRSVFWRGYAALFAWSLLLLLPYLITVQWWLVYLHLTLLAYAVLKATLRQARLNRQEQVVFDQDKKTVSIPPYGEIPWSDLQVAVQEELTVTPKKDLTCWWVTINGQNWKRCEIPEHAQAIADWLRVETCNSPDPKDSVAVEAPVPD